MSYSYGYGWPPMGLPPIGPPTPTYQSNFWGPGYNPITDGFSTYNPTTSPYINTLWNNTQFTGANINYLAVMSNMGMGGMGYDPNIAFWNTNLAPSLTNATNVYNTAMAALGPPAK